MKHLGIDLGTTYTKAAVYDTVSKRIDLVELNSTYHDFGFGRTKFAMPTAVAVTSPHSNSRQFEVGLKAINMMLYPDTLYFDNFKPQLDQENEYACNNPSISYLELIAAILRKVQTSAKLQFLTNFDRIVLTVPASTVKSGYRWNRMLEAAKTVFSDIVVDIIPEPEAAGYALLDDALKSSALNGKTFLIYDFGGGTFDTSVFQIIDEQIFVIGESVGSDEKRRWGGIYVDAILRADYRQNGAVIKSLVSTIKDSDFRQQKQTEEILRIEPVKAKTSMSVRNEYKYSLQDYTLTLAHFNKLIRPMIEDTVACAMDIVKSREDDGQKLSMSDISGIYLVGGSSRIKLINTIWREKQSEQALKYELNFADIEVVAIGAAKYNSLKVDSQRLFELALLRIHHKDYNRAALYLNNADTSESKYLLGLLYFYGLIGVRKNYVKAVGLLKDSGSELANTLLARCAFQGKQGLPRNHTMAKEFLTHSGSNRISNLLRTAIDSQSIDASSLDEIYNYNPLEDFLKSIDFAKLEGILESNNESPDVEENRVSACDPELDYMSLLNKAINIINNNR